MIATSEQYAAMLDAASAGGYALPAVNVTSSETLNGAMRGLAEAGADGIVQVTTGAAEFLSGGAVGDMALGARALAEYARVLYAPGQVEPRPGVLADGQLALAQRRPGARFQYVFHGNSGSEPAQVREAIAHGVVKVNLDTDAQYAFTRAIAHHVFTNYDGVLRVDGDVGRKSAYHPRAWGRAAEAALAKRVAAASELFGAAGRSVL